MILHTKEKIKLSDTLGQFEDLEKYNYVIYKNSDYKEKFYYAYITDLKYINDDMTELKIETDVFQTWQFDFIYKKSFVERKHVTDDIAGNYTMTENVGTGEFIVNSFNYTDFMDECYYIVQTTKYADGTEPLAVDMGGIFMDGGAYVCSDYAGVLQALHDLREGDVPSSAIYNIYAVPKFITQQRDEVPEFRL